jgi:C4-dicarboxylate-specific signal transduction histidine kinase
LGICLVLAVLVSRRLTRNLNQLREGVTLMAQRNLSHRIDIHSGDEIAQLADAYNTMAASLQEYHHSLEEKVAERTATIRKVENRLTQTEKLASIGFLAAGVAHEVNNPITIILTRLELIRKQRGESTSPLLVKDLDTIARHASRIGEIAGGLLTFARTGSKQIGPLDVNKVTGRMCELMAHPIQKKGITFTCRKSDEPLMALGSETGFEQTFYNLLYNAYQSTPAGETITVTTKEGEDAVVVMVADTGPGVAAAHLGKIFDPFFTTKEPGEGTGLGLSVSYGMIHDMGGGLTVESEEGEGATFTIRLRPVKAETGEPQNLPVRMIG